MEINQGKNPSKSIASTTLKSLALRLTIIVLIATGVSFWFSWDRTKESTLSALSLYLSQRVLAEREIFDLANSQHQIIKQRLLAELKEVDAPFVERVFARITEVFPDGTIRNRKANYNGQLEPGIFIGSTADADFELKKKVVVYASLLRQFGPAFKNRFANSYLLGPGRLALLYWPEVADYLPTVGTDFDFRKEEYGQAGLLENNPSRVPVWTGTYYDKGAKTWMVSFITPIDDEAGNHIASIGHDYLLNQLFDRIIFRVFPGTYNFIFRSDGRLIVHPQKMQQMEAGVGSYNINESIDLRLKSQYNAVMNGSAVSEFENIRVIDHDAYSEFLVLTNLGPTNWHLVMVFPKALLSASVWRQAGIIFSVGFATLVVEMLFLWFILKSQITGPLRNLMQSVERIRRADYSTPIEVTRDDEIGQLAQEYNLMQRDIGAREAFEKRTMAELEVQVNERTFELRSQQEAAVQSSRMAALGEMAAGVAHEINNPLAVICGHAEILGRKAADNVIAQADIAIAADRITTTANRIGQIVRGLRAFARDSSEDEYVSLMIHDVVADVLALTKTRTLVSNVEMRVGKIPVQTRVDCRPAQIGQILVNLLNNSFDAVSGEENSWISLEVMISKNKCEIWIVDSGNGISPEVASKIMEPFYTTKAIGKGTGLGLSISHGIAKAHGGNLRYDPSHPNTKFILELPLKQSQRS